MNKRVLAAVASATLLATGSAFAADMAPRPVYKAPPPITVFSWTGCYIGAYGGGAWGGSVDTNDPRSQGGTFATGTFYNVAGGATAANGGAYSYDLGSSAIAGGTLGCNWQTSNWVFGIEGEGGYLRLDENVADPFSAGLDTRSSTRVGDWYGVIAGRLGIAFDRTLIYAKGGVGFTEIKGSIIDTCVVGVCGPATLNASGSETKAFWVAGGGVEWAFSGSWSIKAEYLFLGLDHDLNVCGPGGGTAAGSTWCANHSVDGIHTAKIGINYRFGGGAPLVARY
jgi:outer membrane immunogenic protein